MIRSLLRNNDQVSVRHTVPVNEITHSLEGKNLAHPAPDALRQDHDVFRDVVRKISEVIDMFPGDHEALARSRRLNAHERGNPIILIDEAGGDAVRHDFAEDARH